MVQTTETYVGPMNSGKSRELITALTREQIAGRHVVIFKPKLDDRTEGEIASRNGDRLPAHIVEDSTELITKLAEEIEAHPDNIIVVGIDEAQFFDDGLPGAVQFITHDLDIKVIIAALPRDFRGAPFGPIPTILAMSHEIHTLSAVCTHTDPNTGRICGEDAHETYRSIDDQPADFNDPIILVGDQEEGYAARCVNHHTTKNSPDSRKYPYK